MRIAFFMAVSGLALAATASAQVAVGQIGSPASPSSGGVPGLGPNLSPRVSQDDITNGSMTLQDIREAGQRIFSTPFNEYDGFGDGAYDNTSDTTVPGNRPTVNGTWLRVNGLDSQTCLECHSILHNRDIPADFAPGGVGGIAASAMPGITSFDIGDTDGDGIAGINGRVINPPFVWGSGGVELVAKEMTIDLQALLAQAQTTSADQVVSLDTHGVNFGTILYDSSTGILDTSNVQGVSDDLVVRPFGRKGDNATVRKFDTGAMMFHHGMQPAEIVGVGVDADGDGVADEIMDGELSALHVFQTASKKPAISGSGSPSQIDVGLQIFMDIGCGDCHVPQIDTDSALLPIAYPEVEADPNANVFLMLNLQGGSANFNASKVTNGIEVKMFSDLKRHDVGTTDYTGGELDPFFITPRLWGVADTAPYMHDGSALTITDAIEAHDNEAQAARLAYEALSASDQLSVLEYLDRQRAPKNPNNDL